MKHIPQIILLFIVAQAFATAQAQGLDYEWDRNIGGTTQFDEVSGVDHDNNENVFTAGQFRNTSDFDPGPGTNNISSDFFGSAFVHKMDPNGNLEWVKVLNGANSQSFAYDVKVNDLGEVYLIGSFTGIADFDPGPGVDLRTSQGTGDIFLWKFNNQGDYQWVRIFEGNNLHNQAKGQIAFDAQHNIHLLGTFRGNVDFDPKSGQNLINSPSSWDSSMFTAKLDSSGTLLWVHGFISQNPAGIIGQGIAVDPNGNVYLTGNTIFATVDLDPSAGVQLHGSASTVEIFAMKLDANGQYLWSKGFIGTGTLQEDGRRILPTSTGGAYVMGVFSGTRDFDPGPGTANESANYYDTFVVKLDQNGDFTWVRIFAGPDTDDGRSMVMDAQENIYIAGEYDTNLDLDPGSGTQIVSTNGGGATDIFMVKLDSNGDMDWGYSIGGQFSDAPAYMTRTPMNNYYVAGRFHTTFDADPGPANSNLSSNGSLDVFIAKFSDQIVLNLNNPNLLGIEVDQGVLLATGSVGDYQWLNCQQNMAPIRGETGATYQPLVSGEFAVQRTLNGQVDTSYCMPVQKAAFLNEALFEEVQLYPNPVQEQLNLDLGLLQNVRLEIFNVQGKQVMDPTRLESGIHSFTLPQTPGIYIVQLTCKGQRRRYKIIKN